MSDALHAYIPTDRRHALAQRVALPLHAHGAALFADISGFTPLTEVLVAALGPQRGAEVLVTVLSQVWDALVAEVDDRRGTVINYAGDAMSCWFDDRGDGGWSDPSGTVPSPGRRATSCALAIQRAMQTFADFEVPGVGRVALAVKVAVGVGPVVRFVVGDPAVQLVDVQAGETLQRLARAEHVAVQGDVVVDEALAEHLAEPGNVREWRIEDGERFAVIVGLDAEVPADPWPPLPDAIDAVVVDRWLLPPVAGRLASGAGEMLTELRPAISMFIRFGGIDYDGDARAPEILDGFLRAVQAVLLRFDAYILQVTIGDKGSYVNTAFGAPVAHGDDVRRAVTAALAIGDLRFPGVSDLQIGVARGRTRSGATGGSTRRCYGVMGDPVNLSARLMSAAGSGEILAEQSVRAGAGVGFAWEAMPPMQVKGKEKPVRAFRLVGRADPESLGLRVAASGQAMVGRRAELDAIRTAMADAAAGRGRVVAISGEAGVGKSRLFAEVARAAAEQGFASHGGECQSYGTNASYLVWQEIVRSLLEVDPGLAPDEQIDVVIRALTGIDPALADRAPLLSPVLNLSIPDSDLTRAFDAGLRKASLESLIVDIVRHRASQRPQLVALEDIHWIDPLSLDLSDAVAAAIGDVAVLLVVAHRPLPDESPITARSRRLPHGSQHELGVLDDDELGELVRARMAVVYGDDVGVTDDVVAAIGRRAQGNPFYVEELLNYLVERGLDPRLDGAIGQLSLPDSLHSLILGRIDQLTEDQRTALKVASVVGRVFELATLIGGHPPFAQQVGLQADLETLTNLDLTLPDHPEPELSYLFKHAITHEVAYETLAFATRSKLHDQIGRFLEARHADVVEQRLDLLAHHFDHSDNLEKRREYLRRAGEAAQVTGATASALSYYQRVLPLLTGEPQAEVLLRLAQVHELLGEWGEADARNRSVLELADAAAALRSEAQLAIGVLDRKRGAYADALDGLAAARDGFVALGGFVGASRAVAEIGEVHRLQGRYAEARHHYEESLAIADRVVDERQRLAARAHALKGAGTVATLGGNYDDAVARYDESMAIRTQLGDKPGIAVMLNNQGVVARFREDLETARRLNDRSIELLREVGDRWAVGQLLNNQACVAADQHDFTAAKELLDESLVIRRQLGDRAGLALSLNTLADVLIDEGDHEAALPVLDESLALYRELDDRTAVAYVLEDYAGVAAATGRPEDALRLAGFASTAREISGSRLPPAEAARLERLLAPARASIDASAADAAFAAGGLLGQGWDVDAALAG